jgi:hypothetical protein
MPLTSSKKVLDCFNDVDDDDDDADAGNYFSEFVLNYLSNRNPNQSLAILICLLKFK